VHIAAAKVLRRHFLAGRGLHQRRTAEEDRALIAHDDALVGHGGHIGAARRAAAHHHRDLRDAFSGHGRLIVEDAPEVVAVGEHFVLVREVRAAGIDEVHTGQPVLPRHFLRAQVLLHGQRIIRAALHRGVVAHDHAGASGDLADACDYARGGNVVLVDVMTGEQREFEKGGAGIEQALHALAGQQLAARRVPLTRVRIAAERDLRRAFAQIRDERLHCLCVCLEFRVDSIRLRADYGHRSIIPSASFRGAIARGRDSVLIECAFGFA